MADVPDERGGLSDESADLDAELPTEVVVRGVPAYTADDPDADFPTEVVDRSQPDPADDATYATIALDRAPAGGSAAADPETVDTTYAPPAPRPSLRGRRTARRRGIAFPPLDPGARTAVPAVGPGAVESYPVRELVPPPPPPAVVEGGPAATRAPAPAMPSVERRSRRIGRVTVALVAAAILVSALGLIGIAYLLLG